MRGIDLGHSNLTQVARPERFKAAGQSASCGGMAIRLHLLP
jgi:hypothetical protein